MARLGPEFSLFPDPFGPVLGSIPGSFLGTFWEAGRTPFFVVLGLAWPASKAEVRKSSPRPSHLINFLINLLIHFSESLLG